MLCPYERCQASFRAAHGHGAPTCLRTNSCRSRPNVQVAPGSLLRHRHVLTPLIFALFAIRRSPSPGLLSARLRPQTPSVEDVSTQLIQACLYGCRRILEGARSVVVANGLHQTASELASSAHAAVDAAHVASLVSQIHPAEALSQLYVQAYQTLSGVPS